MLVPFGFCFFLRGAFAEFLWSSRGVLVNFSRGFHGGSREGARGSREVACYAKISLGFNACRATLVGFNPCQATEKNRTFCTKETAKNIENEKNTKKRNFFQKGYLQNGFCVVNYGKNNFTGIGIFCVFFTKSKEKPKRKQR